MSDMILPFSTALNLQINFELTTSTPSGVVNNSAIITPDVTGAYTVPFDLKKYESRNWATTDEDLEYIGDKNLFI